MHINLKNEPQRLIPSPKSALMSKSACRPYCLVPDSQKYRLGQGKDAGATLTIYTRDKNRTLHVFDSKFPKDAAVLFSQTISDAVRRGDKYYIIDDEDAAGYKTVFDWIRQCRETHSDREIPEVNYTPSAHSDQACVVQQCN